MYDNLYYRTFEKGEMFPLVRFSSVEVLDI